MKLRSCSSISLGAAGGRRSRLTVSNAGVRSVDKKGSFDEYLKVVKNKNLSPRLRKLKKGILIKSPFKKKPIAKSA